MKTKHVMYAIFMAFLAIAIVACNKKEENLSVKGITLNKTAATLKINTEEQLTYTIFPADAANKKVTWKSSDETIASVSSEGLVKALKPGNAVISVTTTDNNEKAECAVTVSLGEPIVKKGDVEGVWEKYSVIHVDGHLNIPAGKSLTIEEGVEVIVSDANQDENGTKIEIIVNGNLYCKGTKEAPVLFSVNQSKRTKQNTFGRLWGGIIGSQTCGEILLDNAIIEYTGAITTLNSPSVKNGLFKPAGGEGMVAFNTNNPNGKYVIVNSIFRNTGEDAIYVQGGSCLFAHNMFYANGDTGGEAINVKAGCKVDAAFNLMYSSNTNALKLSSSGQDPTRHQALIKGYNNTMINIGWRRDPDKPKGGSVWLEQGVLTEIYNNLIVNCMFAVRQDGKALPDEGSKIDYNFYASGTQKSAVSQHVANGTVTAFDGFKPNGATNIIHGKNDKIGSAAGENDPKFVNFPFNSNPLLAYDNFNDSWDFHLKSDSPALTGGYTGLTPYFLNGITVGGTVYKSPAPAAHFGAFGTK